MSKPAHWVLPFRGRASTRATSIPRCSVSMMPETNQHASYNCLFSAALSDRVNYQFERPRIPYPSVRYLNPQPNKIVNQFVLESAQILFHDWKVRCGAMYEEKTFAFKVFQRIICVEMGFNLKREQIRLGPLTCSRSWFQPPVILKMTGNYI